jgi:AbrB family looped-hinge helix DNA binding protein
MAITNLKAPFGQLFQILRTKC